MKISISVPGRFHAFHLANQLLRHDELDRLFTPKPKFTLDATLPDDNLVTVPHAELIRVIGERLPVIGNRLPFDKLRHGLFDRAVARQLPERNPDVFVGFSGISWRSLQRANEHGIASVVERCSSHIETQQSIIRREYEEYGVDAEPVPKWALERELAEYEISDYIVTPSPFARQSFIDQGIPAEKVWLVPYAVDPTQYIPSAEDERVNDEFELLFAGRVGLRKGAHYLLDAWSRLDTHNGTLVVAGAVEDSGEFLREEYAADPTVEFIGWTEDIASRYRSASAFVLPTLEEGSAYVTYEAMASGLPVITTAHSGWVGRDGEHGIEVPIRDASALADAIDQLRTDPQQRREMGDRARSLITASFTWDDYGERIREVYQAILADEPATERAFEKGKISE